MEPRLSLLFFLSVTLSIFSIQSQHALPPPTPPTPISTNHSYYYHLCAPSSCNNSTLPYPFALPTPCHPSPLEPFCPNNQSLLLTSPRATDTFRVLSLDTTDATTFNVIEASDSLFTCGSQISRPNYQDDATVFSLPFNNSPGTHFNCTAPIPSNLVRGLQNASCLGCEGEDPSNVCYYAPGIATAPNCETYHMFTPGTFFNATRVRDLRGLLQLGFPLRYDMPLECQGCEASGGRCGANPSTGSFVCFCPSSVHSMNCSDGASLNGP